MKSILITGCNRGLGLGLIKHLTNNKSIDKKPEIIIATCRNIEKAAELRQIAGQNKNLHVLELDVQNFNSYDNFAQQVADITQNTGLNVLINNAGVSSKFTRIQLVKPEQMLENFTVNTVAPIILTKTLLPMLKQAAANNPNKPMGVERAVILNTSSILGSISSNTDGGFYPYRCSKAALNMATRSMSADLKKDGIMAVCVHPGWVKTDMGGPKAPLEIDESISKIVQLLYSFNDTHNGGYYQWDGQSLAW